MKSFAHKMRVPGMAALSIVLGAALATGLLIESPVSGADREHTWDTAVPAVVPQTDAVATARALSDAFAEISDRVSPAVVFIQIEKEMKGRPAGNLGDLPIPEEFFRRFFGPGGMPDLRGQMPDMPQGPVAVGQGSGFIVSSDGYIVTNHHVAGDADVLRVQLADGREYEAELVGSDEATEIALIKVDAQNLPVVPLGDSDNLRVGEWTLAIGSPFGLDHTVTTGIVSARGRGNVGIGGDGFYADFIQTDAAINPGNSGGPLLNLDGEVVGVNTAIMSRSGGSNGIGFAIPVNMVKYVVDELRLNGTVSRGFLGVSIQQVTPELAKWFDLDKGQGVLVGSVQPDSPADKAGIKRDDIIIEFNGQSVDELGAFRSRVSTTPAGTVVPLVVLRDGKRLDMKVDLGTLSEEPQVASLDNTDEPVKEGSYGLAVQDLTNDLAQRLGVEDAHGVVVADVRSGSPAARAGIRPGMLITEVNRKPIQDVRDYEKALNGADDGALLLLQDDRGQRYVVLNIA